MNYIFVHLLNDNSGSPRVLSDLVKNFPKKGRKVIFTNSCSGFLSSSDFDKFFCCFYYLSKYSILKLLLFVLNQVLVFTSVFGYIAYLKFKKEKVTVIINTLLPFGGALAAKLLGVKVIYYIHETYIKPDLLNTFLTFCSRITASRIVFVSKYVSSFHRKWSHGIPNDVIYNPLRSDLIKPERNSSIDFNARYILFVGTLKYAKGFDIFFKLAKAFPEKSFVAVINTSKRELDSFAKNEEVPDNLTFYRRPSNISEIYKNALFTLNLSRPQICIETFGLTLIESMSFGVPVIAPKYGGPLEIVNSKVGFLVEPEDTEQIEKIVFDVTELEWHRLSNDALIHSRNFSTTNYIRAMVKIL
ncbi:putative N-acetylgalactosamine transferase [Vibrio coralliirubri]|uniref:glycosyltransferase n=1 Tax=Vibrio coralliirubri TaxID=1516159 RepID=UPI00063A3D9D|nr:glycosyltransferase [Vibrio coralliirubri]CDT76177.1 putative N-acetylgalactosamine transferase [Vibrio coralliirubri]